MPLCGTVFSDVNASLRVLVVIPVFNDWPSAAQLCRRLGEVFDQDVRLKPDATYQAPEATYQAPDATCRLSILLVNDGSTEPPPADLGKKLAGCVDEMSIL